MADDFSKAALSSSEQLPPGYEQQPYSHGAGSYPYAPPPYGGQQPGAPMMMSGQQQQQQTSTVVMAQPQQYAPVVHTTVLSHTNYDSRSFIWMSAATCIFCLWPIGIVALVFSSISRSHFQSGDEAQGKTFGFVALGINIFNIVAGIVFLIVFFTVIFPGLTYY
ncbi:trafficking regulator of GLUT4 1-like isoform X1 [Oscarella lobularis]|uniref:trafficking regulator of GLUT4 1-like isoform X1 n=1 Tax=Oscarella lobularis TaxID=121494 RepID=UPI003313EDEA